MRCPFCRGSGYDNGEPLFHSLIWYCGLCRGYGRLKWLTNALAENADNTMDELRRDQADRILIVDRPRQSDTVTVRALEKMDIIGIYQAGC